MKINSGLSLKVFAASLVSAVILGSSQGVAWASTVDVNYAELDFNADTTAYNTKSPQDTAVGNKAPLNTSLNYREVFKSGTTVINAKVTVIAVVNLDSDDNNSNGTDLLVDNVDDDSSSGLDLDLNIDVFGSGVVYTAPDPGGYVDLKIEFFIGDDDFSTPVTLENVALSVTDIDSRQYVRMNLPSSYALSTNPPSKLSVSTDANYITFTAPNLSSDDCDNVLDACYVVNHRDYWTASVRYNELSSLIVRAGARESGSAFFALRFKDPQWANTTAPLFQEIGNEAPASEESQEREDAQEEEAPVPPAIHLDVTSSVGKPSGDARALIEGEGLVRNTPYTLRLGPTGQTLYSGVVGQNGRFSELVGLPSGLAPGRYSLVLTTTDPAGNVLTLTQSFVVGAGGVILSVEQGVSATQAGLAATGASDTSRLVGALGTVIGGLGLAFVLIGYAVFGRQERLLLMSSTSQYREH